MGPPQLSASYAPDQAVRRPGDRESHEVLSQRADNFLAVSVVDALAKLFERDVHDVVVMEFLGRNFRAEFQPDAVQQIDFLGRQARRVRTQIKNVLLPVRANKFPASIAASAPATLPRPGRRCGLRPPSALQEEIPRAIVEDCRLCAARRMPSHFSRCGRDGQVNGLASFFRQRQRAGKQFLLVDAKQIFGRRVRCSPEPARPRTRR